MAKQNNPPPTPPQQRRLLRKQDEAQEEKQKLEKLREKFGKGEMALQRWAKPMKESL